MTFSELVTILRLRMPKGSSWNVRPEFWHHVHGEGFGESLVYELWRDDTKEHYKARTPEALLAVVFPEPVDLTEQMALVDAPAVLEV
jgi:hypothetical protein